MCEWPLKKDKNKVLKAPLPCSAAAPSPGLLLAGWWTYSLLALWRLEWGQHLHWWNWPCCQSGRGRPASDSGPGLILRKGALNCSFAGGSVWLGTRIQPRNLESCAAHLEMKGRRSLLKGSVWMDGWMDCSNFAMQWLNALLFNDQNAAASCRNKQTQVLWIIFRMDTLIIGFLNHKVQ